MRATERQGRAQAGAPLSLPAGLSYSRAGARDLLTPIPNPEDSFPPCRLPTLVPVQGTSSRGCKERTPGLCLTSICWASTPGPGRSRPRRGTPRGHWWAEGSPGPTLGSAKSSWRRQTSERGKEFDLSQGERAAPRLGSSSARPWSGGGGSQCPPRARRRPTWRARVTQRAP